ncbi:MAG TPA: hypothetical protein VHO46_13400 [Bacteroidales bacterium]|nr:hypothetical protein [Bacteroidales bacterium]
MNKIFTGVRQVFIIFVLVAALSACEKYSYNPPAVDPNNPWSLATDIQPIFNARCVDCHGGRVQPNLSAGQSYNTLSRGGYVNRPAEQSRLYVQITTDPNHIKLVTETERLKILYWIQQGAKNN